MHSVSTRLDDETYRHISETADERGVSKAEVLREYITEYERLSERVEDLERENERLRNEKRLVLEQREEHTDLVHYVEDEMSYREAGLGTRMKWWLFGKGGD